MDPRRVALVCLWSALAACGKDAGRDGKPTASVSPTAAPSVVRATPTASAAATASPSTATSGLPPALTATASAASNADAGTGDCNLVRGPLKLSTMGAIAIGPGEGGLLAFATNKLGAPAWEFPKFADPPKAGAASLLPRRAPVAAPAQAGSLDPTAASAPERSVLPACSVAGAFAYCADATGAIHKRPLHGEGDTVIAKGRHGTPVSAVVQGGHTFYAFLANHQTTEGLIVRAFAAVDDQTPIALSEDGSGATSVALVARDHDVLAMYIDARTALTPIHARTLRLENHLVRGTDAVVFVGGGAEGYVRGAVGRAESGPAFLFVPGAHDFRGYGVVTVVVDGEPKDDLPGLWSLYPAAPSSSALAATSGKTPVRLVRSRPETKDSPWPQVLDLGHVSPDGTFREKCVLAKGGPFADPTVTVDDKGSLWVAYTTNTGTWVQQRGGASK